MNTAYYFLVGVLSKLKNSLNTPILKETMDKKRIETRQKLNSALKDIRADLNNLKQAMEHCNNTSEAINNLSH